MKNDMLSKDIYMNFEQIKLITKRILGIDLDDSNVIDRFIYSKKGLDCDGMAISFWINTKALIIAHDQRENQYVIFDQNLANNPSQSPGKLHIQHKNYSYISVCRYLSTLHKDYEKSLKRKNGLDRAFDRVEASRKK